MMDDDAILTLQEVAALLKIGRKTAYTMVQRGELPAFRVRGQWRCLRTDLDAWIAKQVAGPGPAVDKAPGVEESDVGGPTKRGDKPGGR